MEIYNNRVAHTRESTLGILSFDDDNPFGFIIEDEPRDIKVVGETRVPAKRYKLGIRRSETPLTLKHRKAYGDWFEYHIELLNVENFTGIYFHAGNTEKHTMGCQIGSTNAHIRNGEFTCSNSIAMMKRFYAIVYPLLEKGEDVHYTILDEI